MTISNIIREVLKRSSGQHKCYKDHCFAVVLYSVTQSFHLVVTGTQIP